MKTWGRPSGSRWGAICLEIDLRFWCIEIQLTVTFVISQTHVQLGWRPWLLTAEHHVLYISCYCWQQVSLCCNHGLVMSHYWCGLHKDSWLASWFSPLLSVKSPHASLYYLFLFSAFVSSVSEFIQYVWFSPLPSVFVFFSIIHSFPYLTVSPLTISAASYF